MSAVRPPGVEVVERDGATGYVYTVGACCRAYRWTAEDHGYCAGCLLLPASERRARQLETA